MNDKSNVQNKNTRKDDILVYVFSAIVLVLVFSMHIHYQSDISGHIKSHLINGGIEVNDAIFIKTNLGNVYKSSEPLVCEDGTLNEYWEVWFARNSGFVISVYPYTGDISKIIEK